ncbi:MAG: trimeric intracellular cation channel family protein [Nitratireductor sp.]
MNELFGVFYTGAFTNAFSTAFFALDTFAAIAFATTGALVASRKQLDLLGFIWFAFITGVGGGTVRDVILDQPVFWLQNHIPVYACIIMALLAFVFASRLESRFKWLLWADALGMAIVTVAGVSKSLELGTGSLIAIIMGVTTASVGGIIRDTIGQEKSVILRREIYVAASALGAIIMVALISLQVDHLLAAIAGLLSALILRLVSVRYNWAIPRYKPRAETEH